MFSKRHQQVKCYLGIGHEREEVASIKVGGYFGETALLYDLPTKVWVLYPPTSISHPFLEINIKQQASGL